MSKFFLENITVTFKIVDHSLVYLRITVRMNFRNIFRKNFIKLKLMI